MKRWIYHHWPDITAYFVVILILLCALACGSLKRATLVGGGAGAGAGVGAIVAGPPGAVAGAIGGAVVGGSVTSAIVESDANGERAERLEDKLADRPPTPPPPWYAQIPWWAWLVAAWVWLRRAHLADALTGKEPRLDAVLRALGLRTHKTPIPRKGGGSS